jgi:uncharacterized protein YlxP (DUF503 family)
MNRAKERLRSRFHAAASEVDTQDLWQRGTLGIALVGLHPSALEEGLAAMRRMIENDPRCQITAWETRVEPWHGAGAERFADVKEPVAYDPGAGEPDWSEPAEGDEWFGPMGRDEKPSRGKRQGD